MFLLITSYFNVYDMTLQNKSLIHSKWKTVLATCYTDLLRHFISPALEEKSLLLVLEICFSVLSCLYEHSLSSFCLYVCAISLFSSLLSSAIFFFLLSNYLTAKRAKQFKVKLYSNINKIVWVERSKKWADLKWKCNNLKIFEFISSDGLK